MNVLIGLVSLALIAYFFIALTKEMHDARPGRGEEPEPEEEPAPPEDDDHDFDDVSEEDAEDK